MLWCFQQNLRYYTFDLKCGELLLFLYVFKLDGFLQKEVNQAILPENVLRKLLQILSFLLNPLLSIQDAESLSSFSKNHD